MIPRFSPDLGAAEFLALLRSQTGSVAAFEQEFAIAFGAAEAVAFPYGRAAQWAFFRAVGLVEAEIALPAYTCSVVAHAVTLSGNHPRFVDINLNDCNMDLDLLDSALGPETRAVIATHTFGQPQDLDRLEEQIRAAEARYGHKIWLMQDCCHAFGAEWRGRRVGQSGDVAVYAFNISKLMTSIFGGMLTFQDPDLAQRIRAWRDTHFHPARWGKGLRRRAYLLMADLAFQHPIYGLTWWLEHRTTWLDRWIRDFHLDAQIAFPPDYLDFMLDIEAAVGRIQLRRYPARIEGRRESARIYHQALAGRSDWALPPLTPGATWSHFAVRVPNRDTVIATAARRGLHLGELIQYSIPSLACYGHPPGDHPNANLCSRSMINLPLEPEAKSAVLEILG